ncbi:flavodoxin domain-containing protein [Halobaculum limi]|uniref:flavodoxin domain-containing protein n=1 Tax=Halobaculum limi TaxID=3031916 RepID=UPI00240609B7|nr:flavodoxin domain-containing protein [Halobaculum sp. YSMS11]
MANLLVAYGTGEGQTAKVAEHIGETLRDRGHDATVVDLADGDPAVTEYDAVLVGSSIHYGKHGKRVRRFVRDNGDALAARPTAFFQLSLASATDTDDAAAETAGYIEEFIDATEWHPDRIGAFGGALRYSEYGFLKRLLMRRITRESFPDADTSGDTEFTDWDEVTAFANDVAAFVEGRLGVVPPEATDDATE